MNWRLWEGIFNGLTIATIFWLIVFFITSSLCAQSVTVSWDTNSENDLAGYKVYWGKESRNYDSKVDIGLPDLNEDNRVEYSILDLDSSKYYFAVTAYDTVYNESDFSNEVWVDFRKYPKNEYIVQEKDLTFTENTSFRDDSIFIWGLAGDFCGVKFTNPDNPIPYKIDFDIELIGSGVCIDTVRSVRIKMDNLTKVIVADTIVVDYQYTVWSDSIWFVFSDDCWIPGESDANIKISNLKQIYGEYVDKIRRIREGNNIMLEIE